MNRFFSDLRAEIITYYDIIIAATPRIILALVIIIIAWFISSQIRRISDTKLKRQMQDPLLAAFLATMIRAVVFVVGLLISLKIIGFGSVAGSILAGAGITAFIIGFALRDIGENFLAGILMAFKRPFRVGDFVESGAFKGRVITLNLRDTQIKTPDGKDVYIPNANIIKNPLTNYTIDGFLRYDFLVGLPAGSDYQKSLLLIEHTVSKIDEVIKKRRKISADVVGISPARVDVRVSFWIDTFTSKSGADKIFSSVILAVQNALEKQQTERNEDDSKGQ
jgi:small conductance mechanosensitive channel